jgi:uncharacterized protein
MNQIQRHPVAAFLVATYLLAGVAFALPLFGTQGLGIAGVDIPVAPFLLLSTASLALVAFGVTAAANGRPGVRELRSRVFRFRTSPVWWVLALVLLPLAALATASVVHGTAPVQALIDKPDLAVGWLIQVATAFVLIQLWEEAGWTGFMLERLQPRLGPVRATLATTWAQAAFHIPLVFIVGGVSDIRLTPDQYPFYFAALFVFPIGNRMVGTWLYNRSGRSVPVVALAHSSWNLAAGSAFLPALVPGSNSILAYAGFAAVAVVLLVVTRGRLGYEEARARDGRDPVRDLRVAEAGAR